MGDDKGHVTCSPHTNRTGRRRNRARGAGPSSPSPRPPWACNRHGEGTPRAMVFGKLAMPWIGARIWTVGGRSDKSVSPGSRRSDRLSRWQSCLVDVYIDGVPKKAPSLKCQKQRGNRAEPVPFATKSHATLSANISCCSSPRERNPLTPATCSSLASDTELRARSRSFRATVVSLRNARGTWCSALSVQPLISCSGSSGTVLPAWSRPGAWPGSPSRSEGLP